MNKIRKIIVIFMVIAGAVWVWPGSCMAFGPMQKEDEAAFLKWYEENKNTDGACYRLKGDLYLTQGRESVPICLDGRGAVTIACGRYGIVADCPVVIDNPNMTISGESMFAVMVRTDGVLTLRGAIIDYVGAYGVAVDVRNGKLLSPDVKGRVKINARGANVIGVNYMLKEETLLSNMSVFAEGSGTPKGINAALKCGLRVEDCDIDVRGESGAYGIYAGDSPDISVRDCRITAAAQVGEADVSSIYNHNGKIQHKNSELVPAIADSTVYQIVETKAGRPAYVEAGSRPKDWQLPQAMETYVQIAESGREEVLAVSVVWELPEKGFEESGYCVVKGTFQTEKMYEEVQNPKNVIPELTVLCLPPEKMFLIAYDTFTDEARRGVQLLVPYPYDAKRLMVEYSMDGRNFQRYAPQGDSNMLVEGESIPKNGMYGIYVNVAIPEEGLFIRTVVEGESMFAGTSGIWKVDRGEGAGIPENSSGDSSGDRGGQDPEEQFPGKEETALSRNRVSGKNTGTKAAQSSSQPRIKGEADGSSGKDSENGTQYVPASNSGEEEEEQAEEKTAKLPIVLIAMALLTAAGIWGGRKLFCRRDDNN